MGTITVYDLDDVELEVVADIADQAAAWAWWDARVDQETIIWVYAE
jgi:hypothetical protein